jgi:diguanylate cyclase (GGDEF)-like protein
VSLTAKRARHARATNEERLLERARQRDLRADSRHLAAAVRDGAERQREQALRSDGVTLDAAVQAVLDARDLDRRAAAADRAAAAQDRALAADDRASLALDRGLSDLEDTQIDDLTGVYMREIGTIALQGELDRSRRCGESLVLASVDVDRLTAINKEEGYAAGDALLRGVVMALGAKLRSYDTIVRVAGDRFLCGLSNTEIGAARLRFEEIRVAVAEIRVRDDCPPRSVTVGLACLKATDTLEELTTQAHADMQARKGAASRPRDSPSRASIGPRLSVVIPTLNEAVNLPHVFAALPESLHEVIVVDGFSTDDTIGVAQALRPDVRIISQDRSGKGNALACAFRASTGDIIVMLDADGSADPSEIPRFVSALLDGADFAKGSRFRAGGGGSADITRLRRVGNRGLNGLVNVLYGCHYTDLCYGYNAFWRHCLPVLDVDCDGFEIETMINCRIARAGLNITEVPSFESARIYGRSNLRTVSDGFRVLRTLLRERIRRAPVPIAAFAPTA